MDDERMGIVYVVGLGPGGRGLLTPQAFGVLESCQAVVGYGGYLSLIEDLMKDKECHALDLGQEMERARLALSLAETGRVVALVSGGDAGIYGMAGPLLETLQALPEENKPEVVVVPGVSAVNAAAALLGAPLGNDFAVISLSDLLTPWEIIEKRLQAAAEADFVLALLNPHSRRRDWQLGRARDLLLSRRPPDTPAGIVRNAYRPGQAVTVTTLDRLTEAAVDMFTTVIVGNSQTRQIGDKLVTPRGWTD